MKDNKMTFQFLIESCFAQFQGEKVTKKIAEEIIRSIFEDIADAMEKDMCVSIMNFGRFETTNRKSRTYVEPREQRTITSKGGRYPRFIPSGSLKKRVRGED